MASSIVMQAPCSLDDDASVSIPNSMNRSDFGMFILVLRINWPTVYYYYSNHTILALEDGIQTAQP
jgi:hypothetical protein